MKINKKHILLGALGLLFAGGLFYLSVNVLAPQVQEIIDNTSEENTKNTKEEKEAKMDDFYELAEEHKEEEEEYQKELEEEESKREFQYDDFDMSDIDVEHKNLGSYITGTIKNNHSYINLEYVKIEFDMIDANGNLLDRTSDVIFGLENGQTWKYEAMVYHSDNTDTIEFHDIEWR